MQVQIHSNYFQRWTMHTFYKNDCFFLFISWSGKTYTKEADFDNENSCLFNKPLYLWLMTVMQHNFDTDLILPLVYYSVGECKIDWKWFPKKYDSGTYCHEWEDYCSHTWPSSWINWNCTAEFIHIYHWLFSWLYMDEIQIYSIAIFTVHVNMTDIIFFY